MKFSEEIEEIPDNKDEKLNYSVQAAIALLTHFNYSQENIISHEDTGRKNKIDSTNEKIAWEWQIDRDNAAMLKKAYKAIDYLFDFVETNNIAEWVGSEKRTKVRSVFISSAREFHAVYPIEESQRFYYELLPFIEENQTTILPQAMGEELYNDFLTKYQLNALNTIKEQTLLTIIRRYLALQTIFTACTRFALSVFPQGVAQRFMSGGGGRYASKEPADETLRKYAFGIIKPDAEKALGDLQRNIKGIRAQDIDVPIIPNNRPENGFFRS